MYVQISIWDGGVSAQCSKGLQIPIPAFTLDSFHCLYTRSNAPFSQIFDVCVWPASGESSDQPVPVVLLFHSHNSPVREVICQTLNVLFRDLSIGEYLMEPPPLACKG